MTQDQSEVSGITISVYVVAEHRLLRESLVRLLQKRVDISVAGASAYSDGVDIAITSCRCDVVLIDSYAAVWATKMISEFPRMSRPIHVIAFGMDDDPSIFLRAVSSGINGYILKSASAGEIIAAVRGVTQGEVACPPKLCRTLFELVTRELRTAKMSCAGQQGLPKFRLTHRQRQFLGFLADGLTNKQIAAKLNLSEFTVKNHIHRIMRQVDAGNRYEVVDTARASGLLPPA